MPCEKKLFVKINTSFKTKEWVIIIILKMYILGSNNTATIDLLYCNKSLLLIENLKKKKKSLKIRELSNLTEIFSDHSLINEFYNASVILSKNLQIFFL